MSIIGLLASCLFFAGLTSGNPQHGARYPNVQVEAFRVEVVELPVIDSVALFDFDEARKGNIATAVETATTGEGSVAKEDKKPTVEVTPVITTSAKKEEIADTKKNKSEEDEMKKDQNTGRKKRNFV